MSAGQHLSDFVGYEVGVPSPAGAGFVGLLDFTGIPVGVPAVVPDECAFQYGAFQSDAFQVCSPTPPTPVVVGGARGYGRRRVYVPPKFPEDDEAIVLMLLELLEE